MPEAMTEAALEETPAPQAEGQSPFDNLDAQEEAQIALERALSTATLDEFIAELRSEIDNLAAFADMHPVFEQIRAILEPRLQAVQEAVNATSVAASDVNFFTNNEGALGLNTVGHGNANLGINRNMLRSENLDGMKRLIIETLTHEARHGVQKVLKMGTGERGLILGEGEHQQVSGGDRGETEMYETDTVKHTEEEGVRVLTDADQPLEYSARIGNQIKNQVGAAEYDRVMTGDGDVARLQYASWLERAELGVLTPERLDEEERMTGYTAEADKIRQHMGWYNPLVFNHSFENPPA